MAAEQINPRTIQREEPDIPGGDEMVYLSAFSLDRQMRESLKEIWFSKELSDFTLIADGEKLQTHKFLLRAHTEYFSESSELLNQSGAALDLKPNTLELVMTFLYLGQVKVAKQGLQDVADAAEFLGIDLLKNQCRYALLSDADLTPENCLDIWIAARDTEKTLPAERALKVALEKFDDLQHQVGFTELSLDCIQEYLSHSGLQTSTEDERLSAAMTWIMADKSRMQHLLSLLKVLPLRDMQVWHIKQVLHSPGVRNQAEARAYMEKVLAELTRKEPTEEPNISPTKSIPETEECTADIQEEESTGKSLDPPSCQPWLVVVDKEDEMWGLKLKEDNINVTSFGKVINAEAVSIGSDGNSLYMVTIQRMKSLYQVHFGQQPTPVYSIKRAFWKYITEKKTFLEVTSPFDNQQWNDQSARWSVMCSMNKKLYIVVDMFCPGIKEYDPLQKPDTLTNLGPLRSTSSMRGAVCCALTEDESLVVAASLPHNDKYKHIIELYSVAKQQTIMTMELPRFSNYHVYRIFHLTKPGMFILVSGDYTAVLDMTDLKEGHTDKIKYSDKYTVPNINCIVALSSDREYIMLLGGQPKTFNLNHHYYYRAPVQAIINNTGSGWEKLHSNNPLALGKVTMKAHSVVELPHDYDASLIYWKY